MSQIISKHFNFINSLLAKRYKTLLISLVAFLIVPSFLEGSDYQSWISSILNGLTIFLCIFCIQESKIQLYGGIGVALLVLIVNQLGIFSDDATIDFYISFIIYLVFYSYVAYRLFKMILVTENVGYGVLLAAIIVYLLMGVVGGYLFMLVENAQPGSINGLQIENLTNPTKFIYFSFISLSTLGFGDITPAAAPARALCMILSTAGPLYLTILVALLVSRFEHSDIH